jgi:uncharacterized protein YjbI with pentapeptide repeats
MIDASDLQEVSPAFKGEFSYEDAAFSGSGQPGVTGEGALRRCVLSGVDLTDARLSELDMADVRLRQVNLSNASVQATSVKRVEFLGSQGIGLRLAVDTIADFYAEDCKLDYATIAFGRVKGAVVFQGCSFREVTFDGELSNVVFSECDFAGAEFQTRRAEGCDLRGSRLAGARGLSTLRGAKITVDQAISIAELLAADAGLVVVR